MPLGDNALPLIEDTIRCATAAARTADTIANVAIRISLKNRVAAGEALAAAQQLIAPTAWPDWLARIGISPREAKRTLSSPANIAAGAGDSAHDYRREAGARRARARGWTRAQLRSSSSSRARRTR